MILTKWNSMHVSVQKRSITKKIIAHTTNLLMYDALQTIQAMGILMFLINVLEYPLNTQYIYFTQNRRLLVIFTGVSLGLWLSIQIVYWAAIQPLITLIWLFLLIAAAARLINIFFVGKNIRPVKYFPAQNKEHGNSFILAWFLISICLGMVLFIYILYKYNSALLLGLMLF